MTLRIGAFSHILLRRGASKFENHLVSGRKVSHRAKIVLSHFRGALSECPRDKFLIPTLTRQYIGQAWACVICLCACVCVSSCMSILYCPGVLSGSRAAWSTEITVSSEGGGAGSWGGWWRLFLGCWSPARRLQRNPLLFPTQHQHRPRLTATSSIADPSTPGRAAITGTWTNLVLYGSMGGEWGKRCRYHGNCLNYHIHDMHVVMPIVTNAR